ncbi:MAG: type II toxin-antitoxin system RelE/ParE family toxin [Bacteroidales bacterium]|nr:type II toxin-antitoxin system RelE/ParE family toxin [Bacteroidales bacterium]
MNIKQFEIELSDDAEFDFDSSYLYYFKISEMLASRFYNQINSSFKAISINPQGYQEVEDNVRRFVVRDFPFVIYYQIKGLKIRIIAVFHASRNPRVWVERI